MFYIVGIEISLGNPRGGALTYWGVSWFRL